MTIASFKRAICATAISSSLLLTGCVIHVSPGQIAEQKQQDLSVSAANINELKVDAEAGSLIIKGDSNATAITGSIIVACRFTVVHQLILIQLSLCLATLTWISMMTQVIS